MSENKALKSKGLKSKPKSKKAKQVFLFDLEDAKENKNSRSCEKLNMRNRDLYNMKITNNIFVIKSIDDLKVIPLKDIRYIFSAWKNSNLIFEKFEKKILNKKKIINIIFLLYSY